MQNAKCKMQNEGIAKGDLFKIICEANLSIMHTVMAMRGGVHRGGWKSLCGR